MLQQGSHHLCPVLAAAGGKGLPVRGADTSFWKAAGSSWGKRLL